MATKESKKVVNEIIEEECIAINFKSGQLADADFVESVKQCKFYVSKSCYGFICSIAGLILKLHFNTLETWRRGAAHSSWQSVFQS